jgi:hypothetical protein
VCWLVLCRINHLMRIVLCFQITYSKAVFYCIDAQKYPHYPTSSPLLHYHMPWIC